MGGIVLTWALSPRLIGEQMANMRAYLWSSEMCDEAWHLHCKIIGGLLVEVAMICAAFVVGSSAHLPMLGPPMQWLVQTVVDPSKFKIPANALSD